MVVDRRDCRGSVVGHGIALNIGAWYWIGNPVVHVSMGIRWVNRYEPGRKAFLEIVAAGYDPVFQFILHDREPYFGFSGKIIELLMAIRTNGWLRKQSDLSLPSLTCSQAKRQIYRPSLSYRCSFRSTTPLFRDRMRVVPPLTSLQTHPHRPHQHPPHPPQSPSPALSHARAP